jgi:uncharacterized protein
MPPYTASLDSIQDFLAQKRFAFVGISRDPKDFSTSLFREFVKRGYDVVPVNPKASEILGKQSFPRIQDIKPPVDSLLVMTSPEVTETVVAECVAANVRRVWLYRATGTGAVSPKAVELCQKHGISVIPGECPFMFFAHNSFHASHGLIRWITGSYPKHQAA